MNEQGIIRKLKNAKTDEEKKQIIEANKAELTEAELENIGGGLSVGWCGGTSHGPTC